MKTSLPWLALIIILQCWACNNSNSNNAPLINELVEAWPAGQHFISVDQAEALLATQQNVIVFEISKAADYEKGHLADAYNLWRPDYENKVDFPYEGMNASPQQMEAMLSQHGVSPTSAILLYDTKGNADAVRLMWILNRYGHPQVAVMDGGKTAWQQAGNDLQLTTPAPKSPTQYHFSAPADNSKVATREELLAAIQDTNIIILDTREPEEYAAAPYISKGKLYPFKEGAYTRGCIPGAVHVNWSNAVDLDGDHRIKSVKALQHNFSIAGLSPNKQIITYCQSGVRSAHTTYVLTDILGYPNVKNYDGSWIEWSYFYTNGQQVPIEQKTSQQDFDRMYQALAMKLKTTETVQ